MVRLGAEFLQGIGFGDQPSLMYRHIDAGHPHMHIVTTNIRPDGSRISNDQRSPQHLKELCFNIETAHHLTHCLGGETIIPSNAEESPAKAEYGRKPTKQAIAEVLAYAATHYAFTSLEGFNALLSLYNIRADRGNEQGAMYRNKGLYYRMIDESGIKIGAPIKASAFHWPVTLNKLEQQFQQSQTRVRESYSWCRTAINLNLQGSHGSLPLLAHDLLKDNIQLVIPALRQRPARGKDPAKHPTPEDGHGFFFVDYTKKVVIRDTDLGQDYSAASILRRAGLQQDLRKLTLDDLELRQDVGYSLGHRRGRR
jgi:hypothetical protein